MKSDKKEPVPKIKILLDTNVIISAFYLVGKPLKILELARSGDVEIYLSPFILNETCQVLQEKLHWEAGKIRKALAYLESLAKIVQPKLKLDVVKGNEPDNRILEAAVESMVDFLVTGDSHHLQPLRNFKGIAILSPADFLDSLLVQKNALRTDES
jgi:putative PIN family toxin of toxin-antitoxin system